MKSVSRENQADIIEAFNLMGWEGGWGADGVESKSLILTIKVLLL